MEKTEETRITSLEASESPSPDPSTTGSADKPAVSGHWARYTKVFTFFGFQKAYNFPLCESQVISPHTSMLTATQG